MSLDSKFNTSPDRWLLRRSKSWAYGAGASDGSLIHKPLSAL